MFRDHTSNVRDERAFYDLVQLLVDPKRVSWQWCFLYLHSWAVISRILLRLQQCTSLGSHPPLLTTSPSSAPPSHSTGLFPFSLNSWREEGEQSGGRRSEYDRYAIMWSLVLLIQPCLGYLIWVGYLKERERGGGETRGGKAATCSAWVWGLSWRETSRVRTSQAFNQPRCCSFPITALPFLSSWSMVMVNVTSPF